MLMSCFLIISISNAVSISWSIGCCERGASGAVDKGREGNTGVGREKGVADFHC
jgi:hypothetical protein